MHRVNKPAKARRHEDAVGVVVWGAARHSFECQAIIPRQRCSAAEGRRRTCGERSLVVAQMTLQVIETWGGAHTTLRHLINSFGDRMSVLRGSHELLRIARFRDVLAQVYFKGRPTRASLNARWIVSPSVRRRRAALPDKARRFERNGSRPSCGALWLHQVGQERRGRPPSSSSSGSTRQTRTICGARRGERQCLPRRRPAAVEALHAERVRLEHRPNRHRAWPTTS